MCLRQGSRPYSHTLEHMAIRLPLIAPVTRTVPWQRLHSLEPDRCARAQSERLRHCFSMLRMTWHCSSIAAQTVSTCFHLLQPDSSTFPHSHECGVHLWLLCARVKP